LLGRAAFTPHQKIFGFHYYSIFVCTLSIHLSSSSKKNFLLKIFFILAWNLPLFIVHLLLIGYHPPTFIVSLWLLVCAQHAMIKCKLSGFTLLLGHYAKAKMMEINELREYLSISVQLWTN
jgi:hypothetical protein